MRSAVTASALGHALIIGWGLVSLPSTSAFTSAEKPLPVDLVSIDEFTQITAGEEKAEPKPVPAPPMERPEVTEADRQTEKPQAPKAQSTAPEIADVPKPEPKPREVAALPPAPEPKPEPVRQIEPAPAPKAPEPAPAAEAEPGPAPAAEAEPAPQPTNVPLPPARPKITEAPKPVEPKPEPPKPVEQKPTPPAPAPRETVQKPDPKPAPQEPPRETGGFDADRIAALLNKVPQSGGGVSGSGTQDPGQGMPSGTDMTLTMSEIDALRRQISQCWSPPIGVLDAGQMNVRLNLAFNPDGTLTRDPQLLNPNGQQIFMIAAEAARRAVISCQPYHLPAEKYDLWREVNVNFDPRDMLGG
ncbi:hypothetical protein [Lutibaculum baratangense]|uniref:TolA protein n=1 Tax=Lutibaculum baratangense AMV1 TaxID=631454 RepID=V4RSR3_9HYPH|nr:hypothetical protein [Lutibaculum baratangense]ESR26175.1 hypothetical protein N177_1034 [Lutibaculum baratangense AMV1]